MKITKSNQIVNSPLYKTRKEAAEFIAREILYGISAGIEYFDGYSISWSYSYTPEQLAQATNTVHRFLRDREEHVKRGLLDGLKFNGIIKKKRK